MAKQTVELEPPSPPSPPPPSQAELLQQAEEKLVGLAGRGMPKGPLAQLMTDFGALLDKRNMARLRKKAAVFVLSCKRAG